MSDNVSERCRERQVFDVQPAYVRPSEPAVRYTRAVSQKSDPVLNRYFAHRLDELLPPEGRRPKSDQQSARKLADRIGTTAATVSSVRSGKQGVGFEVLPKFVAYFGFKTQEEARQAALEWLATQPAEPSPEPVIELDVRYANSKIAAQIALENDVAPVAVEQVLSRKFDRNDDPPVGWWYDRMKAADAELRAHALDPGKGERDTQRRIGNLDEIKRREGGEG